MDISDVVRRSGVPASTLRYYQKKGLLRSIGPEGKRRQFGSEVLDRLALIALGQAGGLSLDAIRSMLPADAAPQIDRDVLLARADDIDATIRRLRAMSQGLRHVADCPAASHAACPTFQRWLKAASAERLRQSR